MSASDPPQNPLTSKQLWVKSLQLQQLRRQLIYVDYPQAERDCEALAVQLLTAYPAEGLRDFTFIAIPRGGLIVLGMLSYWLDLAPAQMAADASTVSGPLCVVDDCSLTGLRFKQVLARSPSAHVVFAHLYSHPDLRRGILERESRVRCCLAARDLAVMPGGQCPSPHEETWEPMPLTRAYWSGAAAPIAFAWSEPVIHVRDPFSGQVESGWRFASPQRCTKNRVDLGVPLGPAAPRRWQAPEDLVVGQLDGVLWLARTLTGAIHSFRELAADAWRGLAAYGDEELTLDFLAERYPLDRAALQAKLAEIMSQFLAEGLLEAV